MPDNELTKRDPLNGHYLPGNKSMVGCQRPHHHKISMLRSAMLECCTAERMHEIMDELFDLIRNGPPKVRLEAIIYLHNRIFGKPEESLQVEVTKSSPGVNPADYTDEQIAQVLDILERPARKNPVIEVEAITQDALLILPEPKPVQQL